MKSTRVVVGISFATLAAIGTWGCAGEGQDSVEEGRSNMTGGNVVPSDLPDARYAETVPLNGCTARGCFS